jgi:hypothetical protein
MEFPLYFKLNLNQKNVLSLDLDAILAINVNIFLHNFSGNCVFILIKSWAVDTRKSRCKKKISNRKNPEIPIYSVNIIQKFRKYLKILKNPKNPQKTKKYTRILLASFKKNKKKIFILIYYGENKKKPFFELIVTISLQTIIAQIRVDQAIAVFVWAENLRFIYK